MGLDEAGRGAVLGPLVVGAFWVDEDRLPAVHKAGATDSKRLTPARREALIGPLRELGQAACISISAAEIDEANINALEERAFVTLIRAHRPDKVVIDAPCNPRGIPNFQRRLLAALGYSPELVVEPKADLNYPVCGAASIFAKVTRDQAIDTLGPEAGSGYPSDPVTRDWILAQVYKGPPLPSCIRQRWGTLGALKQKSLF